MTSTIASNYPRINSVLNKRICGDKTLQDKSSRKTLPCVGYLSMSAICVIMVCLTSSKVFKRYSRIIFEHFEQLSCCKKRKIFLEQLWSSFLLLSVAAPFTDEFRQNCNVLFACKSLEENAIVLKGLFTRLYMQK